MADLERRIEFTKARDCHDGCEFGSERCKPGGGGYHGIHGMEMRWLVIGPEGAIQFVVYTNWHAQKTRDRLGERKFNPMPADLGYHARTPQYDGQEVAREDCDYIGGPCYYDGSGLYAEDIFEFFVTHGGDALWTRLEAEYATRFAEVVAS